MEAKVLVLNQDYQAISVCSVQRAFVLCYLHKAEMLDHYPDRSLRSIHRQYNYPSIIRLYEFVKVPYRKVSLSRINIFRRDGYQCQYCGTRSQLTLDHVQPRSRGGKDTWENLTTACHDCNTRKGNKTPQEAAMPLMHTPFRPSFIMFISNFSPRLHDNWRPYLMM